MIEDCLSACKLYLKGHPEALSNLTDLGYKDKWSLAVALILATRTKDTLINKLLSVQDLSFKKVNSLSTKELQEICKPCGFSWKGDSLKDLAGKWDSIKLNPINIRSVKGCGQKIEDVFLNVLGYEERVGVDTHVQQICRKILKDKKATTLRCRTYLNNLKLDKYLKRFLHTFLVRYNKGTLFDNCPWCRCSESMMRRYE